VSAGPAGQGPARAGGARLRVLALLPAVVSGVLAAAALHAPPATAAARAPAAAPAIRAPSAILVEPATGDVVLSRRADGRRAIASTTKLMTALVVLDREKLSKVVRAVPYRALPVESVAGLRPGERLTVADLVRAMLVASANDAAATLATRVGGSPERFVALMNASARSLGLRDTHFSNPIGLDEPGNYSSASDLVKLTLILRRSPFFRAVTDRARVTLHSGARPRTLLNRNLLVRRYAFVNGVKTGHTQQAGYVLIGSATRHGVTVLSAVLGDAGEAARDADTLALLRYGLSRYRRSTPVRRNERFATARLRDRDEHVDLVAARTVHWTVRRGEPAHTRVTAAPHVVDGPLPARARVGTVQVRWRGHVVARVPLVTRTAVGSAGLLDRADDVAGRTLLVFLLAGVALGSLQLALLRRRARRRRALQRGGTEVA
jgi:D-alanyl-D-alanine carboxypeptidase (penicillin-binding protein 5/6)